MGLVFSSVLPLANWTADFIVIMMVFNGVAIEAVIYGAILCLGMAAGRKLTIKLL